MTHSVWIQNNYDFLERWSKIWAKDGWSDLLNLYVEYLDEQWLKFGGIPDDEQRLKFTNTWLKNMSKWSNSEFNRQYSVNDLAENWEIRDSAEDNHIEVLAEADREDLKLWMRDLYVNYGEEGSNKLMKIRQLYLRLETHEKVLYDLYFTQMLSLREISKKIDLNHMAVFFMVKDLKNKLRTWIGII